MESKSYLIFSLKTLACALSIGCSQTGGTPATSHGGSGGASTSVGPGGDGGALDTPVSPQPLKIMNWNTHNLYNDAFDSDITYEDVYSAQEYQARLEEVAAVIRELDPDIAVLQEIEHLGVLSDLAVALDNTYSETALVQSYDLRNIAALSKIPFDDVVSHLDETFPTPGTNAPYYSYARDCLELHLTFNTRKLALLGVHYLSKVPPDNPARRFAEAAHTRQIADALGEANPDLGIVILGDFNDTVGSDPYEYSIGEGPVFTNAALFETQADAWTIIFENQYELIDHQLVNPVLAQMLDETSVVISHAPEADEASDHAPVMATYNIQ